MFLPTTKNVLAPPCDAPPKGDDPAAAPPPAPPLKPKGELPLLPPLGGAPNAGTPAFPAPNTPALNPPPLLNPPLLGALPGVPNDGEAVLDDAPNAGGGLNAGALVPPVLPNCGVPLAPLPNEGPPPAFPKGDGWLLPVPPKGEEEEPAGGLPKGEEEEPAGGLPKGEAVLPCC